MYDTLLASSEHKEAARTPLSIVLAVPGIDVRDLQIALFFSEKPYQAETLTFDVLQNDEDFKAWIAPICGFFFEYEDLRVRMFHQTASTFLQPERLCEPEQMGFRHTFHAAQYLPHDFPGYLF